MMPPSHSPRAPGDDRREPRSGEALGWLRSDRSQPPGFLPAFQAADVLAAWTRGGGALEEVEARCLAGDSAAARGLAMVHATAASLAAADALAVSGSSATAPGRRTALRDRLLRSASGVTASGGAGASVEVAPVVAIARRHAFRAEESARDAAIARLGADVRSGDAALEQVLERLASVVDFPLLVVSVVHGGETVHRAYRCTVPGADGVPRVVPREASFCTHCVADGSPLIIHDAASDPFFQRHPAVAAFGLVSYCGVPLRVSSSGDTAAEAPRDAPILGTLCGYDVRPRELSIEDVALLEVFSRRIVAELEGRPADPDLLDVTSSARAGVDVLAATLFHDVLEVELLRAAAGRATALLVGPAMAVMPAAEHGLSGRLQDGRAAWLLSGDAAAGAPALAAKLAAAVGSPVGLASLASAEAAFCSVGRWIELASPAP